MKDKSKKILNNKGVTGIDLTIAIIILSIFAGLIVTLMSSIYENSIEIQKNANAMAYATILLEKVDEKSFDEIGAEFVNTLKNNGEIDIDNNYRIDFSTETIKDNLFKKVVVKVSYNINEKQNSITISKLKIKEIYREWIVNVKDAKKV